jgi:hypothetical protein
VAVPLDIALVDPAAALVRPSQKGHCQDVIEVAFHPGIDGDPVLAAAIQVEGRMVPVMEDYPDFYSCSTILRSSVPATAVAADNCSTILQSLVPVTAVVADNYLIIHQSLVAVVASSPAIDSHLQVVDCYYHSYKFLNILRG